MSKIKLLTATVAITLGTGLTPSFAVPFNTFYVDAENGADSATCGGVSLVTPSTGPCATLNRALENAAAGQNIVVVHGGAFGPIYLNGQISITGPDDKSLRIINNATAPGCIGAAPGTCAASTTAGIEVNAGSTDHIQLKNMVVSAGTAGTAAILIDGAAGVAMTDIAARGGTSTSTGAIVTATPSVGNLALYIHNCDIAFSTTMGDVLLQPTGSAGGAIEFSGGELHHAVYGLQINANSTTGSLAGAFDSSQYFGFNNSAVSVAATGSGLAHIVFSRSTIVNTGGAALKVNGANALAEVYENVFTGDGLGVNVAGGSTVVTFGNSAIFGNGTDCAVSNVPTPCSTALTSKPLN